ncbi:autotransporter domain-containing protein, partial [Fusobacterium animalis]
MDNNLYKVEKNLRSIAKRYKSIKYSTGLAILFLMLGVSAFSEEVNDGNNTPVDTVASREEIESARESLKDSVGNLQSKINDARIENAKQLVGARLELVQLMEQGDQVVKSPWSSWQFGANYMYSNWRGTYKGRGDKSEKYPFEGVFVRDVDEFNRYMPTTSENYGLLTKSNNPRSAASNAREKVGNYGIASNIPVPEPPVVTEVNAGITPKYVNKVPLDIAAKSAKSPILPEPVKFEPINPRINIPRDPALPDPPAFQLFLGADSNWQIGPFNDGTAAEATRPEFYNSNGTVDGRSKQNIMYHIRYTLDNHYTGDFGFPQKSIWTAFKMWTDDGAALGAYDLVYDSTTKKVKAANPDPNAQKDPFRNLPNDIYFNSYNFSYNGGTNEFTSPIESSVAGGNPDNLNNQRFFVGGSRFMEVDIQGLKKMDFNGVEYKYTTVTIPERIKLHLAGPLTLGMVSQENGLTLLNKGTITDEGENTEKFIRDTPDALDLNVPLGTLKLKKSKEGYLGYKVGIAQVAENSAQNFPSPANPGGKSEIQPMINEGTIDFKGPNSMGMYVYLYKTNNAAGSFPAKGSRAQLENKGKILLHGKESYGMRFAAYTQPDSQAFMHNNNGALISLGVNGKDKADNSVAMAIMDDKTVQDAGRVTFPTGRAVNKGTISLTGVENSVGAFINIASDITNDTTGKINIDSIINKTTGGNKQSYNIGMRSGVNADNANVGANVINKGEINLKGTYAIGMLANSSKLTNINTITSTNIKNGIGIVGINGATVENRGTIKLTGTGDTNNIGVFLDSGSKGITGTIPTGVTPSVEVIGNNSTGVLVTGKNANGTSNLTMAGTVKVSGNSVAGIVANGATVNLNGTGTITVDNNGTFSAPIGKKGSYGIAVTKDKNTGLTGKFEGKNTTINAKISNPESIGLYSEGNLTVNKANITTKDGAINFFADNGGNIEIKNGGTSETGQKSLLFYTNGNGKINLSGGTLNATIKGGSTPSTRGTAFYYVAPGASYGAFNTAAIQSYFNNTFGNGTSTLNHLKLNMEAGSRLFVASNVGMNLSDTSATNLMSGITNAPTITGSNYKTFMLYLSKLTVNNVVNLDNATDPYNQLEIANSSIENKNTISGTKNRQVAMAQENGKDTSSTPFPASKVKLINDTSGKINLTGEETTGMYVKRGQINNKGEIGVGKKSTAIYLEDDDLGTSATEGTISNSGKITLGENSTGVYFKNGVSSKAGGVTNSGKIGSSANNVIAMTFDTGSNTKVFKNDTAGEINLTGDNSIAMYATGAGTYTAENAGKITLGNSVNVNNPNIAMFTDKSQIILKNNGKITAGN